MTNPMRTHLQQNKRIATTLLAFALLATFISLVVFEGDGAVSASQLFQSPPPGQEEPAPKPTPERILPPTVPPPTAAPATNTPPPPVEPEPAQPESPELIEVPTAAPSAPDNAEIIEVPSPTQPAPANVEGADVPPPAQPAPVNPGRPEVVIDSGLLIDSVLVYISYAWLCCGVIMFVMIPMLFLVLYVWGAQRTKRAGN